MMFWWAEGATVLFDGTLTPSSLEFGFHCHLLDSLVLPLGWASHDNPCEALVLTPTVSEVHATLVPAALR